jgi:SPP1 family holin
MNNKGAIVRMLLAVLAAAKLMLAPFGVEIPQELIDAVSDLVAAAVVVYAAWKDNPITARAKAEKAEVDGK